MTQQLFQISVRMDISEVLSCISNPETNGLMVTPRLDREENTIEFVVEPTETELEHGEHEREAIWSAKELRGGLSSKGWQLLVAAAEFEEPFGSSELAAALEISEQALAHRMRALGRTRAYRNVEVQQHDDVPISSRRERGQMRYWMAPWWQNAIQSVAQAGGQQ